MAYHIPQEDLTKFKAFHTDAKRSAGYMSSEFQRRRAAFQFSRARESTSGALDMRKLASYKTRDDIFRSTMQLANAQSHGMFMLIDQSSSMHHVRGAVAERVIELCEFCKMSSIPFVVYSFTSGTGIDGACLSDVTDSISMYGLAMCELVNSSMSANDYAEAILDYWYVSNTQHYNPSARYDYTGSTPLLESLILTHSLAKDFKRKTGIQKLNLVVISDGDGSNIHTVCSANGDYIPTYRKKIEVELNGKRLLLGASEYELTYTTLIKNLRETLDAKVICFFLFNGRTPPGKLSGAGMTFKNGDIDSVSNKLNGYDIFFGMKSSALESDSFGDDADELLQKKSDLRVKNGKDGTIKLGDIRSAFIKASVNRTDRNQFAQKFIQTIA